MTVKGDKRVCKGSRELAGQALPDARAELFGHAWDIAEPKQADQAAQGSGAKYHLIVENANQAIVVAQDGMLRFVNSKATEITGYSREELTSRPFTESVHPDDREMVVERHLQRLRGEHFPGVYPFRIVDKDGKTKWGEINAVLITWEGRPATLNFLSDITERKQAEEELRRTDQRYRLLADNVADAIWTVDLNMRPTYMSPSVINLLGYSTDEAMAKAMQEVFTPTSFELAMKTLEEEMAIENTGHGPPDRSRTLELDLKRKDGSIVPIEGKFRFIRNADGRPVEILAVARDITERKRAEAFKERMQAQLFRAQKMEAIGTLAGGIAHDFNNLLTAVQGYAEVAMDEVDRADRVYGFLERIHGAATRGAGLTRQLLLFSRRQPMQRTSVRLNTVVNDLLEMLTRLMPESIAISVGLEPDLAMVAADAGKIEQVIMNLAINARDAMPRGGTITIETGNVSVDEEYCRFMPEARPGRFVRLSVADNGVGMSEETLPHIFEPFFTTKEAEKGTGLGLAVVYGIVKEHEGWIDVNSEPGRGTICEVYLPAYSVEPEWP